MYQIRVVVKYESFCNVKELWDMLLKEHYDFYGENITDDRLGSTFSFEDYIKYLESNALTDLRVEFCGGTINYGDSFNAQLSKLDIKNFSSSESDAEKWLEKLLTDERFIQAYIYDDDYDTWQNMEDLNYYESEGRSYEGLPLKSNGLPFPLESEIIDISKNPGRSIYKKGYIESVGAIMWLGEKFWENTGVKKDKVLDCDWLDIEEIGSVLKIKVQKSPFSSSNGHQKIK